MPPTNKELKCPSKKRFVALPSLPKLLAVGRIIGSMLLASTIKLFAVPGVSKVVVPTRRAFPATCRV